MIVRYLCVQFKCFSRLLAGCCNKQTQKITSECNILFFSHTALQVGIESPFCLVTEDAGPVMVCATTTGTLARNVVVTFTTMDGSAMGQSVFHE